MKTNAFLKIGRWIIVVLQLVAFTVPFLFLLLSYRTNDDGIYDTPLGFSDLALVPEDKDALQKLDNVSIVYRNDEQVKTELTIEKTKIKLKNGISFVRARFFFMFLIFCSLGALGLEAVKRIIKVTETGNPFNHHNVRNIFILSAMFFLAPFVASIYHYLFGQWMLSNFELTGLILEGHSISYFPWIVTSIVLFTIGKVIEQGIKMREEQELTI